VEIKMIGYGSVWLVFLLLLVLARRRGMGMAEYLYAIGRKKGWSGSKGVREDIRILQPDSGGKSEKEEEYVREFYIGKIRLLLQMLFAGSLFAALLLFAGRMDGILEEGEEGNFIKRNGYGLGSRETKLRVETMEEDGVSKSRDITFTVEEMQYEDALVETMADKLAGELPERILGDNLSLEEVREDYVLLVESKGLGKKEILFRHCLPNVLPSYLSIMAVSVPHILGGTYVVETVFSYPGIGTLSYESARYQDYNLLMVLCIFSGILVILCNLAAQMLNERIDPRIRAEERAKSAEG